MGDYTPTWLDKLQDKLAVPTWWCKPLFSLQWGWGTRRWPNPLNLTIRVFDDVYWPPNAPMPALYMNGMLFFSLRLPFFFNLHIRWWNDSPLPKIMGRELPAYVQTHLGWRPVDGRPVAVLRFQSDASAQGGLALGFENGPK